MAFKNHFDTVGCIYDGYDRLFDKAGFETFTANYLNFPGNRREK